MEVWLIKLVKWAYIWSSFAGLLLCCTKLSVKLLPELCCKATISVQYNVNNLLSIVAFSKAILSHENCMSQSVSILSGTYSIIYSFFQQICQKSILQSHRQFHGLALLQ